MNLSQALDEYDLLRRRRQRGDEGRLSAAALVALRDYLVDYSGYEDTADLRASDLFAFLLDYYPSEEEPDAAVAMSLLEVSAAFARWLIERDERALVPFAAAEFSLRDDLPRVLEAYRLLKEHTDRDSLSPPASVTTEEGEEEVAEVATQYQRIARLDQVDYGAAQQDYYRVARIEDGALFLTSGGREALGEGEAGPLRVPVEASERLRPDDTIHAEIAPGTTGSVGEPWELLEVLGVRPGGY